MTRTVRRVLAAALVVAAGGAWAALSLNGSPQPETAAVHREDLVIAVEASGELDAVRSSLIGPPGVPDVWDYKISMLAPESADVRRGDPILGFDTTNLQRELQKRQVEYQEAAKNLEMKDVDLSIQQRDLGMRLAGAESNLKKQALKADQPAALAKAVDLQIARLDRDLAAKEVEALGLKIEASRRAGEADMEAYREKRDRAAARIREIETSIEKMTVRAPQDGIVIYQANWQGEKKKVGDSTWRAEKVMKIPDLSEMMVKAEVDEADAGRLVVGQPAVVRIDAIPDADFTGRVQSIGRIVKQKARASALKIYTVELSLDRTDPTRMRPGMRLRSEIEVERVPRTLVAPREAVFLREAGPVVLVKAGKRFVETPVTIGRRNARLVEILAGASEGDVIARRDIARDREKEAASAPVKGGGAGT